MEKVIYHYLTIALTLWFFISIYAMDLGASLQFTNLMGGGTTILQSLFFAEIEPRVIYHLGMVSAMSCFLATAFLAVHSIEKRRD